MDAWVIRHSGMTFVGNQQKYCQLRLVLNRIALAFQL